jgi:multicomponent Na+:H+ antiporter subunit E
MLELSDFSGDMQARFTLLGMLPPVVALMTFWLVMSGFYDLLHVGMGAGSVALVLAFNSRLRRHRFFADEGAGPGDMRPLRALYYLAWLAGQVVLSGLHIAGVLLRRRMPIDPVILTFRVDLPTAQAKFILGNSITLTPGTLTIDISDDLFTVHGLTGKSCQGLIDDSMPRQVLRLYTAENRPVVRDLRILRRAADLP